MNPGDESNTVRSGPAWSRPEFLFTATAVMLLTGVLIPWPDRLLDILWICQLSLTAAVLVICASARSSNQLEGFPALLAGTSLLSLLATAGCMRAIVLRQDTCGRMVRGLGEALAALEPMLTLILLPVLGFFLLYLVGISALRIRHGIEQYLFQVLPFKKIGLETDRDLHILTRQQAEALHEKIRKEARFYASMNGLRKLLTAQISVNLFLLLAAGGLAWAAETLQAAAEQTPRPLETLVPVLAGTAVFAWVPVAAAAAACGMLLNKESLALPRTDPAESSSGSRKIKIVSTASGQPEEVELINPESLSVAAEAQPQTEKIAQFEPQPPSALQQPMTGKIRTVPVTCQTSAQYYQTMAKLFQSEPFHSAVVLLTAESVEDLPVAAAVHPAVQLAQTRQNVLLMDADLQRYAVAKVFEVDPQALQTPAPIPRIDHLWLQCLSQESVIAPENLESSAADFAFRIIYAPQGYRLWNRLCEQKIKSLRVLFFSTKKPEEIGRICPEIAEAGILYVVPPLHTATAHSH